MPRSPIIGFVVWLIGVACMRPMPFDKSWALAILAFAPLVIVPISLHIAQSQHIAATGNRSWRIAELMRLPAALSLAFALTMTQSPTAALLAVPWFAVSVVIAATGILHSRDVGISSPRKLGIHASQVMLAVGAAWAVLDRWGIRPLEFEPVIVMLTAIHFHYAGFALPLLAGMAAPEVTSRWSRAIVVMTIISVPAVALGITTTQLQLSPLIETSAAWLMSVSGILVGWCYWRLSFQPKWPNAAKRLWRLAAISLVGGMVLACLYGSRHFAPMAWLDIPWMRALHGTANAYGFTLGALLGWCLCECLSAKSTD